MKNIFTLLVILCMLSGCFTVSRPATGTITYGHLSSVSPNQEIDSEEVSSEEAQEEKTEEKKEQKSGVLSPAVGTLLGMGAVLMIMSLGATMYDDGNDEGAMYFALATGGLGLSLWGAAGITALVEE